MDSFSIWEAVSFLKKYIKPYIKHFIAFYAGWLVETIAVILTPKMLGIMLDQIIYQQDLMGFFKVSLVVVFLSVFSCILYYWIYAQHHYLMIMYTFGIKVDVLEQFMEIEPEILSSLSAGELISLIQEYPSECMHFLVRGFIHQINNVIIVGTILILSFKIHVIIGILMLLLSIVCAGTSIFFGRKNKNASIRQRRVYGDYIGWLYEVVENAADICFLNAQDTMKQKYKDFSNKMFLEQNKMHLFQDISEQVIKGIFLVAQIGIFFMAAFLTGKGALTVGAFTVIVTYFNKLTSTIIEFNQQWNDAQTRAGYVQKIKEFMEYPKEKDDGKQEFTDCLGEINIQHMKFSYGQKNIYEDFSMDVKSNEKVAIVGESGIGKSTLADLLVGLLEPDAGKIMVDGVEIENYTKKSLRKHMGILFQESLIFEGSLKDNLMLGNPKAQETEIWHAVRCADLEKCIADLPEGLDTWIGNEGVKLSGGQKQRLAIAQICLRNPKIIILDEPTSALDHESEEKIIQNWKEVFKDKTVIVITHRKKPLELCQQIIKIG